MNNLEEWSIFSSGLACGIAASVIVLLLTKLNSQEQVERNKVIYG